MSKYLVRTPLGNWLRAPHWGNSPDISEAHPYDMSHPTDRKHLAELVTGYRERGRKLHVRVLHD